MKQLKLEERNSTMRDCTGWEGEGDSRGTCHTCSIFLLLLLLLLLLPQHIFQYLNTSSSTSSSTHLPVPQHIFQYIPLCWRQLQHRQGNNPFASGISSPALFNIYLVLMKTIESKPVIQLSHLQKDSKESCQIRIEHFKYSEPIGVCRNYFL